MKHAFSSQQNFLQNGVHCAEEEEEEEVDGGKRGKKKGVCELHAASEKARPKHAAVYDV